MGQLIIICLVALPVALVTGRRVIQRRSTKQRCLQLKHLEYPTGHSSFIRVRSTRGAIAALLDDLSERRAKIQADQTLSTKERNRLTRAAQAWAAVELGALAGTEGVPQTFLAQALAEGLDVALPAPEPPPRRPWWAFWRP